LLTKAKANEPILEAIADHPRMDVRLKVVHMLGCTGHPDTFAQLRELAVKDGIGEVVKTALLEAMYKLDQNKLNEPEVVDDLETQPASLFTNPELDSLTPDEAPGWEAEPAPAFDVEGNAHVEEFER
jgi:hypothetical protein